jgi:heme/copper-type cytochrome/quinol oxidase subunit 2
MLAQVRAVPPDQYVAWIQRQKRLLAAAEADRKRDASTFESQQGGG